MGWLLKNEATRWHHSCSHGKAWSFKVSPPRWSMYGLPSCEYLACIPFVHMSFFFLLLHFWLLLLISLWCFIQEKASNEHWTSWVCDGWENLCAILVFLRCLKVQKHMIEKNTFLQAKRTFVGEPITQTWKLRKAQVVMGTYKFQSPQALNFT